MTLRLDARQRAMLAEMGIPWPEPLARELSGVPDSPSEQSPAGMPVVKTSPAARAASLAPVAKPMAGAGSAVDTPTAKDLAHSAVDLLQWDELRQAVAQCTACALCKERRNTVFGVGDPRAEWLIVGEAPGENEDRQGEPFVGQAGKLLDNMLKALHLTRHKQVYIANVLKCRPPANRNPLPEEVAQCEPFLRRQVQLLQPRIILAMGRFAVQTLLGTGDPIGKLRGRIHRYQQIPVVVTYHPAYLLRNPADKARAWDDLCLAQDCLSRQPG
jgi:DNA polymerase